MSDFEVIDYGPKIILAGQAFNVQADGSSVVWIRSDQASPRHSITLDGMRIYSYANDGMLSATMPDFCFEYPRQVPLEVHERGSSKPVAEILIPVSPKSRSDAPVDSALLQKYLAAKRELFNLADDTPVQFRGWGMSTQHAPAWANEAQASSFFAADADVRDRFTFSKVATWEADLLDELRWRHYNVTKSIRIATQRSNTALCVECGVGDGITAAFALHELTAVAAANPPLPFHIHLYDAWEGMAEEQLEEGELAPDYEDLSLDRTRQTLEPLQEQVTFHKGRIPDSLDPAPYEGNEIAWLHIDLNAARPSIDALNFFLPRMSKGAVVLFDDYGWESYKDTRLAIDEHLRGTPGELLPLPTGQAIFLPE